jgi:magnesium-transporting ATPase (P-type)
MMDWSLALWAGLAGGIVMWMMMALARMMGLVDARMIAYEGCMITKSDSGAGTWIAGMAMHLILSVLIAFAYAWAFEAIWGEAGWFYGAINGVVHWLIGGMVLPMMDGMNPCVKDGRMKGLGLFGKNYGGMMVVGFLMSHLVYGAIVGWIYRVLGS